MDVIAITDEGTHSATLNDDDSVTITAKYVWWNVTLRDDALDPGNDEAYHEYRVFASARGAAITRAYQWADQLEHRRVPYAVFQAERVVQP